MCDVDLGKDSLAGLLRKARLACVDDRERYFGCTTADDIISPRNESAALSLLLQELHEQGMPCRICHLQSSTDKCFFRPKQRGMQTLSGKETNRHKLVEIIENHKLTLQHQSTLNAGQPSQAHTQGGELDEEFHRCSTPLRSYLRCVLMPRDLS
jgi:hypothetical protein